MLLFYGRLQKEALGCLALFTCRNTWVFGHFAAKQLSSFEVVFWLSTFSCTNLLLCGRYPFRYLGGSFSDIYLSICARLQDILEIFFFFKCKEICHVYSWVIAYLKWTTEDPFCTIVFGPWKFITAKYQEKLKYTMEFNFELLLIYTMSSFLFLLV